jgi:hypothetical protein
LHDFQITANDTTLIIVYDYIPAALGPLWVVLSRDGFTMQSLKEIQIDTGELFFRMTIYGGYEEKVERHAESGEGGVNQYRIFS